MATASNQRSDSVPKLRVFIASSSELAEERRRVVEVLKELSFDDPALRGRVHLEPVRWDHPGETMAFRLTSTAQQDVVERIGKPSTCQIVVGMLWSKLGQPIKHADYCKQAGGYFTGTEWELEEAAQAWERSGHKSPHVYLFKCTRQPVPKLEGEETNFSQAGKRLDAQLEEVAKYLSSLAERYGSHPNKFETPGQLEEILRSELRTRVSALLDEGVRATSEAEADETGAAARFPQWEGSPFRGLETFDADHAPVFYGRATETAQLVEKLADSRVRFLLVAGASGTGKSSLVAAGLLPALKGNALPNSATWQTFRFTPAAGSGVASHHDPYVALANALKAPLGFTGSVERLAERCRQEEEFLPKQLDDATKDLADGAEWLLFIDQFEELFTRVERGRRIAFAHGLKSLVPLTRLRIVATMRSEFLDAFTQEPTLNQLTTSDGATYTISTPKRSALYQMITGPAWMAGLEVSPDLAMKMLDDAGAIAADVSAAHGPKETRAASAKTKTDAQPKLLEAPIALPIVEFTLQRLYDQYHQAGRLTVAMYEEIGGISGAIEKCLEDTVGVLAEASRPDTDDQQTSEQWERRFADLFKHLVDVNEAEVATRRRARIEDVQQSPAAWRIARDLQEARLLVTREETIEVAHEALFSAWAPLARWIEQRKVALREWRNMEFAAAEWDRKGRPAYLRWPLERLPYFESDTAGLGRSLSETQQAFLGSEVDRLLDELENLNISHERRADIGNRLSHLGDPRPGLGFLEDGTPDVSRRAYWCPVLAGTVTLEDNAGTFDVEQGFTGKYLVTRAQFRAFQVAEDGYRNPAWWDDLRQEALELQPEEGCNRPATHVSWYDATAYCRWLSRRLGFAVSLPTEWQWQQAATGGDPKRAYPWGGEWDGRRANTAECSLNRTTAAGMYPGGAAANGVLDLAGNVWEWCLNKHGDASKDTIDKSGDARVLRGGSWGVVQDGARCAGRGRYDPDNRSSSFGFRVLCSSPIFGD